MRGMAGTGHTVNTLVLDDAEVWAAYCWPIECLDRERALRVRERALRTAFATVRREVWARRELALRYITDAGENWTIA